MLQSLQLLYIRLTSSFRQSNDLSIISVVVEVAWISENDIHNTDLYCLSSVIVLMFGSLAEC